MASRAARQEAIAKAVRLMRAGLVVHPTVRRPLRSTVVDPVAREIARPEGSA